jgi:hypothetical protein
MDATLQQLDSIMLSQILIEISPIVTNVKLTNLSHSNTSVGLQAVSVDRITDRQQCLLDMSHVLLQAFVFFFVLVQQLLPLSADHDVSTN